MLQTQCGVRAAYDPNAVTAAGPPPLMACTAVWDTGATGTVVTQAVVDRCGLKSYKYTKCKGVYGAIEDRETYMVDLGLPNGILISGVPVVWGGMHNTEVLIGMDIITMGDFAVTHEHGHTVFSFRTPSIHTIDYVKQWHAQHPQAGTGAPGGGLVNPAHRKKGKR